jgi:hypothetical protein
MADDAPTTDAPAPEAPKAEATPEKPATGDLGDAGKKALDAERKEKRAAEKRAADLEARLKEFEERDKTEAEKIADRAKSAEDRATQAESRAMRLEVAFDKGRTPAQAKRLVGSTREELEADADEILRDFPVKPAEPDVPDLDLGTRGTSKQVDDSPRGLIAAGLAQSTKKH